jgi:hypothetical protein
MQLCNHPKKTRFVPSGGSAPCRAAFGLVKRFLGTTTQRNEKGKLGSQGVTKPVS